MNQLSMDTRINRGNIAQWKTGLRRPSDVDIEKIASVPGLGIIKEQLEAWRVIEIYGADAIRKALEEIKEKDPQKIERAVEARKQALGY